MSRDDERLTEIATSLQPLHEVPRDLLADLVWRRGLSTWWAMQGEPPTPTGDERADRELASRLCAGCPVQAECLELELRLHGTDTTGVWGALSQQDRRALYPLWREHGGHDKPDDRDDRDGGEPS